MVRQDDMEIGQESVFVESLFFGATFLYTFHLAGAQVWHLATILQHTNMGRVRWLLADYRCMIKSWGFPCQAAIEHGNLSFFMHKLQRNNQRPKRRDPTSTTSFIKLTPWHHSCHSCHSYLLYQIAKIAEFALWPRSWTPFGCQEGGVLVLGSVATKNWNVSHWSFEHLSK